MRKLARSKHGASLGPLARLAPLAALALLPAAAIEGCFSSDNSGPSAEAGADVIGPGDAQVDAQADGPSDAPSSIVDQGMEAAAPPLSAGGTGAFGIVTIGGKQKMYLPQQYALANGNASIAVVDVSAPGNGFNGAPAQITDIDLGSSNYATATGGDSTTVIAVSIAFNSVYFIDPVTDTLTKTITLDPSYGMSSFSGGGGFVTGVAVDSVNHRAILSVWNGFAIVDLTTQSITTLIQAPPSENFGFDSVHQWIIAPFYDCTSSYVTQTDGSTGNPSACTTPMLPEGGGVMTDGLSVIDLKDNSVYTYEASGTPDGGLSVGFDPTLPLGSEPDSAAIDPTTGVAVIPSEGGGFQNIIDLAQATFSKVTMTVTAPQNIIPGLDLEGVAVEPNKHLAFWEGEDSDSVAVADLTQANMGGTAAVQGTMPTVPGGGGFQNLGDPHGIAVTTSLTTAGPVGFLVDSSYRWVARVDLAAMLAAGGTDGSATLDDLQMAPFVTFLDALTPENPVDAGDDAASE
jgi:hypothetical protein